MERPDVYPFLERTNHRQLSEHVGDVLIWDIDKTYLDTRFSSLRGLLSIPLELAVDKRALPGTVPLLRALRRGPGERSALVPLYFVSGSPPQLRRVIEEKMTLDGVGFDGITFKDQLGLLRKGRPKAIVRQVGYKLIALLLYRLEASEHTRWLLFGDDVEADAEVFCLFGDVCAGLSGQPLERRLRQHRVESVELRACLELAQKVALQADPVERIFIHLASRREPRKSSDPRVFETRSFLQTALVLADMARIHSRELRAVVADIRRQRVPEREVIRDIEDAAVRFGVSDDLCRIAAQL